MSIQNQVYKGGGNKEVLKAENVSSKINWVRPIIIIRRLYKRVNYKIWALLFGKNERNG